MSSHVVLVSPKGKAERLCRSARPVEVSGVDRTDEDVPVSTGDEDGGEDVSCSTPGESEEAKV